MNIKIYIVYYYCVNLLLLSDYLQIENELRKKSEGKKMRDDRDVVQNALFAAFEKHQYYNIKDLERITKQPVVSLNALP